MDVVVIVSIGLFFLISGLILWDVHQEMKLEREFRGLPPKKASTKQTKATIPFIVQKDEPTKARVKRGNSNKGLNPSQKELKTTVRKKRADSKHTVSKAQGVGKKRPTTAKKRVSGTVRG